MKTMLGGFGSAAWAGSSARKTNAVSNADPLSRYRTKHSSQPLSCSALLTEDGGNYQHKTDRDAQRGNRLQTKKERLQSRRDRTHEEDCHAVGKGDRRDQQRGQNHSIDALRTRCIQRQHNHGKPESNGQKPSRKSKVVEALQLLEQRGLALSRGSDDCDHAP